MPILPIIDLLILMGWTSLFGAAALKAIYVTTNYHPTLLGMGPLDLTILAGVMLLFSVAVSARTWVKSLETQGYTSRDRAAATLEAYTQLQADAVRPVAVPDVESMAAGSDGEPAADRSAEAPPTGTRSAISA